MLISDSRGANFVEEESKKLKGRSPKGVRAVFTPLALFCLSELKLTGRAHLQDENPERAICAAKITKQEAKENKSLAGLVRGVRTHFIARCHSKNRNLRKSSDAAVNYVCTVQYVQMESGAQFSIRLKHTKTPGHFHSFRCNQVIAVMMITS